MSAAAPPLDTTPYHTDFGKGMPLSNHDDWGSPAYYGNNTWIYNSFSAADAVPTGDSFLYLAYFVLAMSFGILIHSFYLNRFKMTTIRICTDAACVCTIVQFFLLFQCASGKPCGQYKTAILVDVLANGAFSAVVQACDNYITFIRYAAVVGEKRISRTRKILTLTYVFVFLFVCWWPYYWLVPFFVNMNTPTSLFGYTYSQYVWNFPAYILYNLYHSGMLVMEVKRIHSETTLADTSALEIMAWRAIFHDCFSIVGIICYCFIYPIGAALQVMFILFGLHFVFNWKMPTKFILTKTGLVKTKPTLQQSQKSQKSSEQPSDPNSDQLGNMSLFTYTYRSLSVLNMNMTRSSTKNNSVKGKRLAIITLFILLQSHGYFDHPIIHFHLFPLLTFSHLFPSHYLYSTYASHNINHYCQFMSNYIALYSCHCISLTVTVCRSLLLHVAHCHCMSLTIDLHVVHLLYIRPKSFSTIKCQNGSIA